MGRWMKSYLIQRLLNLLDHDIVNPLQYSKISALMTAISYKLIENLKDYFEKQNLKATTIQQRQMSLYTCGVMPKNE